MTWLSRLLRTLFARWGTRPPDADLDEELRLHLDLEAEQHLAAGMTPEDAVRRAHVRLGNRPRIREEVRAVWRWVWLEELGRDMRIGVRTLLRRPGFAVSVILTLAVGIGANVAVFSVVHAVLIRPFAYPAHEPDRVLLMAEQSLQGARVSVSYPTFRDWRDQLTSFASLAGAFGFSHTLSGAQLDGSIRVRGLVASASYFGIHGIQPLHGRVYDASDDRFGAAHVVVLSHRLWRDTFGGRADVVGEAVRLLSDTYTIIGVLPPGVDLHRDSDFYMPLEKAVEDTPDFLGRGYRMPSSAEGLRPMQVYGRLKAGVTVEQARAELTTTAASFEITYPETNAGVGVVVDRLREWRLRSYRTLLWALQAAVLLLWLIATINVANLMVARAVTRRRQYAVSAALGAGALRTLRPLLVENLILSLTAGGAGLVIALGAVQLLRTLTPFDVPRMAEAQLNGPVAALGLGLAMLAGLVAGLLPGLRVACRVDVTAVLNEDGAQARAGGGGRRLHRGLLVTEVALATLLLVLGRGAHPDRRRPDPGGPRIPQRPHLDRAAPIRRRPAVRAQLEQRARNHGGLARSATAGRGAPGGRLGRSDSVAPAARGQRARAVLHGRGSTRARERH